MSFAHPRRVTSEGAVRPPPARLTAFERWAWAVFGTRRGAPNDPRLADDLVRAHWRLTPEEFGATRLAWTLAAAAGLTVVAVLLSALLRAVLPLDATIAVAAAVVASGTMGTYLGFSLLPSSRAAERGRAIDRSLGPALNFVAALSCADVPVDTIFRELASQDLYGEVAAEASWIVRDSDGLGVDILSAIRSEARHSPSVRFQEFLQGVVTTAESGGELRPYFLAQADRFEREGTALAQGQLERLGVLAEAYVAVAVAFPLFLLVLLTVFTLIEGTSSGLVVLVWLTAVVLIPAAEAAFALIFQSYREGL